MVVEGLDSVGFVQKLAGVNQVVFEGRIVEQLVDLILDAVEVRSEVVRLLVLMVGLSSLVAPT